MMSIDSYTEGDWIRVECDQGGTTMAIFGIVLQKTIDAIVLDVDEAGHVFIVPYDVVVGVSLVE